MEIIDEGWFSILTHVVFCSIKKKSHVSGAYQKSFLFRSFVYTQLSVDQVDRWCGSVQVSERTLVTDVHRHVFVM